MRFQLKAEIKERAAQLGFDECRFTSAEAPDHARDFERWLAAERHGEMDYLRRNAAKRMDPQQVLPGAKTIVALAASYHHGESPSSSDAGNNAGQIARYACFEDYHKVIGDRLESLTSFVNALSGPDTRSLWYVDTGPRSEE